MAVVKTRLSIAMTADPFLPVPPLQYGGIERVIQFLADGLVERGHRVVLFAHRDSKVRADLVPYPTDQNQSVVQIARNAATIGATIMRGRYDIVHSFGRLNYLVPLALTSTPKIMSYQRPITPRSIAQANRVFGTSITFTACSRNMIEPVKSLGDWRVVHNGVPLDTYTFQRQVDANAPLVFLGRFDPEKGAHLAIEVAKRAGRRIVLAGNIPVKRAYFEEIVRPLIDDDRVRYIGPVDDRAKNELLGAAAALLMPILWEEPFGIVMAEALACGTPVIGFGRGSVPEVVRHGVTGFVANDVEGLVEGVAALERLDREYCRRDAEARFSDRVIVDQYEAIYFERCRIAGQTPAARTA